MPLFLYQMVIEHPKRPLCTPCPAIATSLAMQASAVETAAEIVRISLPVLCGRSKQTLLTAGASFYIREKSWVHA